MSYRPDIDGLRGMALILGLIYHGFPSLLPNGFIAIEFFFVISGFLITSINFENLARERFSLGEFYGRRIRRLFPSLGVVLTVCLVLGWYTLLADEYRQLGKHVAGGAGMISNFILRGESGYFDASTDLKPLKHLWTLGVEEQFYLVLPIYFFAIWRLKFDLLASIVVAMMASLTLSVHQLNVDPIGSFYSPLTRAWQFLAGSMVAWFAMNRRNHFQEFNSAFRMMLSKFAALPDDIDGAGVVRNIQSALGLVLLLIGLVTIGKTSPYPGILALIPTCSAALFIAAGPQAWLNRVILSWRPIVWIGAFSYPIYLWHWPLLSLARIAEGELPSAGIRAGVIGVSVVLAWLTFVWVEKPMRSTNHGRWKVIFLTVSMMTIGVTGYLVYRQDGLPLRSAHQAVTMNQFDLPYRESCATLTGEKFKDDWCNRGTSSERAPTVILTGDSFSSSYGAALTALERGPSSVGKFSFVQFGRGQCPSLIGYGPKHCREMALRVFEYVKSSHSISIVVMASHWSVYNSGKYYEEMNHFESAENFKKSLQDTIAAYKKLGKKVVVFLGYPSGVSPRACIVRPFRLTNRDGCRYTLAKARANESGYRDFLIPFLASEQVPYFDPLPHFCDMQSGEEGKCKIVVEGKILWADVKHLSVFGGEFLAESARKELEALLY